MKLSLFVELQAAREKLQPVALVTQVSTGQQALVGAETCLGDLALDQDQITRARAAIIGDHSGKLDDGDLFVQAFNPPLRLVVVGAVHIAQALVPMARLAGYQVIVIDPRRAWASEERFPEVTIMTDWPDEALRALKPDRRTAVVALTHDPKIDDPALSEALRSDVFYAGALGSRKTHKARLERLTAHGFTEADFARIHGPIGIAIGAKSPAEIAIAILAEMTQVRRGAAVLVQQKAAE